MKALTQINDLYQKGYFGKDALSAKGSRHVQGRWPAAPSR
jgi:hypothetical protein